MDIVIGDFQFGIEFNKTTKREEIVRLQASMEEFFAKKNYSPMVEFVTIKLFCLPFCFKPHKRPMYYEVLPLKLSSGEIVEHRHLYLCTDITIENAEEYLNSNKTIIDYFQNNPLPVKIRKSFNLNAFLDDLKTFFNEFIKTRENTVYK